MPYSLEYLPRYFILKPGEREPVVELPTSELDAVTKALDPKIAKAISSATNNNKTK